jgi:hypothetical protein
MVGLKHKHLLQITSDMVKQLMITLGLLISSCSVSNDVKCDKSGSTELHYQDKTINNNLKLKKEYNIRIYQFGVDLDLNNFKLCDLDGFEFEILGELNNEYNPQRAHLKLPKKKLDSLYFQIYGKSYVITLNNKYNHYSLYLDKDGNIENLDADKNEFLFFE